jgi:hypothetical protein
MESNCSVRMLPTAVSSAMPSRTIESTEEPTVAPNMTIEPTEATAAPSAMPSRTIGPTDEPTAVPSMAIEPSVVPSGTPSRTIEPSYVPTVVPNMTMEPTEEPAAVPSAIPTLTVEPSQEPTHEPTTIPVVLVDPSEASTTTAAPSVSPNLLPRDELTEVPSAIPTIIVEPTVAPTAIAPSAFTNTLSLVPTTFPSVTPSAELTTRPSIVVSIPQTTFSPSQIASSPFSVFPTLAPIVGNGSITYKVILGFADVAGDAVSPVDELVLSDALANIVGTADGNVKFLMLRTVAPARRRRLSAYSMTVVVLVGLDAVDFPQFQGSVSKIYENTTGNCLEAFKNGHLTNTFHQVARHFHSGTFEGATVISIAFEDAEFGKPGNTNTNSAAVSKTTFNKKTMGAVIACCTLIGSAICLFMICFAWKTNSRKTAPLPTTENIEEMDKIAVFPGKRRGWSVEII